MPFFNETVRRRSRPEAGFTLLEVMIAVALIAIALVTLIGAQSQSVSLAAGARFDTLGSLLAQAKMTELCLIDFAELASSQGDFGAAYPRFSWKAEVDEVTEGEIEVKGIGGLLKTLDVTVMLDQDPTQSYALRTLVFRKTTGGN